MKIYIVSTGEYSDWSIVGVFSNKEVADEVNKTYGDDGNAIEEYDVDSIDPKPFRGKKPFLVMIDREGNMISAESSHGFGPRQADYSESPWVNHYQCRCWAKDETEAIKITNDVRARYIAEGGREDDDKYLKREK